jgi:Rieske Fe-S protein
MVMEDTNDSAHGNRRQLLAGAGAAGVIATGMVGTLAACGSSSDSGSGSSDGGAAADGGGDLGKTSEIPVGGGKVFDAQKVVVTQPTANTFKAFTAVCTHMGCLVTKVEGGVIMCPCHSSQYSIEDGSVKGGPAPAPLTAKTVTNKSGELFLGA